MKIFDYIIALILVISLYPVASFLYQEGVSMPNYILAIFIVLILIDVVSIIYLLVFHSVFWRFVAIITILVYSGLFLYAVNEVAKSINRLAVKKEQNDGYYYGITIPSKSSSAISREGAVQVAIKDNGGFIGTKISADFVPGRWTVQDEAIDTWHIYSDSSKDYMYIIDANSGKVLSKHMTSDIKKSKTNEFISRDDSFAFHYPNFEKWTSSIILGAPLATTNEGDRIVNKIMFSPPESEIWSGLTPEITVTKIYRREPITSGGGNPKRVTYVKNAGIVTFQGSGWVVEIQITAGEVKGFSAQAVLDEIIKTFELRLEDLVPQLKHI